VFCSSRVHWRVLTGAYRCPLCATQDAVTAGIASDASAAAALGGSRPDARAGPHGGAHVGSHGALGAGPGAGSAPVGSEAEAHPDRNASGDPLDPATGRAGERVTTLAGARRAWGGRAGEGGAGGGGSGAGRALLWSAPLLGAAALVAAGLWRLAGPAAPPYEPLRAKAHASPVPPRA